MGAFLRRNSNHNPNRNPKHNRNRNPNPIQNALVYIPFCVARKKLTIITRMSTIWRDTALCKIHLYQPTSLVMGRSKRSSSVLLMGKSAPSSSSFLHHHNRRLFDQPRRRRRALMAEQEEEEAGGYHGARSAVSATRSLLQVKAEAGCLEFSLHNKPQSCYEAGHPAS